MASRRDYVVLALVTLVSTALCVVYLWISEPRTLQTWVEAVSFVTGAVCVWLTVKENVWNFPIGIVNAATAAFVYFNVHLFADAGLQIVFLILGVIGWYLWLFGGEHRTELHVSLASNVERAATGFAIVAATAVMWWVLKTYTPSNVPFLDGLTTAISLGAQWLLNRKKLENWVLWIVVDVIYVPLLIYKGLWLLAILYAVFLCMAVMGLLQWLATWRQQRGGGPRGFGVVPTAEVAR